MTADSSGRSTGGEGGASTNIQVTIYQCTGASTKIKVFHIWLVKKRTKCKISKLSWAGKVTNNIQEDSQSSNYFVSNYR